jgi:DNA adenine methylase
LDLEIVNVFRVLQDPSAAEELRRRITLTPYARAEFALAATIEGGGSVRRAWRTIVRSFMGHGSDSITIPHTGFRANANRNGTTPAQDWTRWPDIIPAFVERLRGVVIECRPAVEIILQHDGPAALIYADPPYVHSTRSTKANHRGAAGRAHGYRHEMTDDDHRTLAEVLHTAKGMVVLSGYQSDLYEELYGDWRRISRKSFGDGAVAREESLWFSPNVPPASGSLFAHERGEATA